MNKNDLAKTSAKPDLMSEVMKYIHYENTFTLTLFHVCLCLTANVNNLANNALALISGELI